MKSFRESRDICRESLGAENVVFLVLNMTKRCQRERLKGRHGGAAAAEESADLGKEIQASQDCSERNIQSKPI